jgi:hypothetical protein
VKVLIVIYSAQALPVIEGGIVDEERRRLGGCLKALSNAPYPCYNGNGYALHGGEEFGPLLIEPIDLSALGV